jgi:hypothetical protein
MSKNSTPPEPAISGIQDLALNTQDLQQLGMTQVWNETDCQTQENYANVVDEKLGQYSICNYTINSLNDTWVVIELNKFANYEELNGTFEYESQHLFSVQGIISVNDYGDQSLFRVNNVNDYMGQLNNPNVYNYHLWICKNLYLIHITSRGSSKDAVENIPKIGLQILSKFE